jgi:hypothetical protein
MMCTGCANRLDRFHGERRHCDRCGRRIPPAARMPVEPAMAQRLAAVWNHRLYARAMATPAVVVATMQRVIGYAMIAVGLAAAVAVTWTELRASMAVSSVDLVVMAMIAVWIAIGAALVANLGKRVDRALLVAMPARVLVVGALPGDDVLVTLGRPHRRRWLRVRAPRELGARLVAYSRGVAFVEDGRLLDFVRLDA